MSPPNPGVQSWAGPLRLGYLAVILLATLGNLQPDFRWDLVGARLEAALDLSVSGRDVVDGLRNLALFGGWGMVWVATAPGTRLLQRVRDAVLTGGMLSVGVEVIQLTSPTRVTSILDVLSNMTGAAAGALGLVLAAWATTRRVGARSFLGVPAVLLAAACGAAVALEALVPLTRQELLPGSSGGPLARLAWALQSFRWASIRELSPLDLLLFAPAGGLAVAALVEEGRDYRRAFRVVAAGGIVLAVVLELLRGTTGQPIVAGAAVTHAAAILLGGWVTSRNLPGLTVRLRGARRSGAFLAGWAVYLALWLWRPFGIETSPEAFLAQFSPDRLIPLAAHAQRMDLFSVVDVARNFLLMVPAGALLAVWPLRPTGTLKGVLPAIWLAFALEGGQLLVAGRFFDVTDALVFSAGALMGWVLIRRSDYPERGRLLTPGPASG